MKTQSKRRRGPGEIRFECQGSGRCCVTHGESGYVYLTPSDVRRLVRHLRITAKDLRKRYGRLVEGRLALKDAPGSEACIFLSAQRCSVYDARPTQCRTWPFWPELLSEGRWSAEVASFCPGVGRGRLWTREEIDAIVELQRRADAET